MVLRPCYVHKLRRLESRLGFCAHKKDLIEKKHQMIVLIQECKMNELRQENKKRDSKSKTGIHSDGRNFCSPEGDDGLRATERAFKCA